MSVNDDSAASALLEPAFVGEGRLKLVDGLLNIFDQVKADRSGCWVSLETPSGWGKTRVVREFYARLAAERQPEPKYWPETILGSLPSLSDDVSEKRKQVFPHVKHVPNSVPHFFWWGISASMREKTASDALRQDLQQVVDHKDHLDDALKNSQKGIKVDSGSVKQISAEVFESVLTDTLIGFLGITIPGAGFAVEASRKTLVKLKEQAVRRDRFRNDDDITGAAPDVVAETLMSLTRLAKTGPPIIVFVEDLQFADETLIELLKRCSKSNSAIMVVTTGWPGNVDSHDFIRDALSEGVIRLSNETTEFPEPFPAGSSLTPLDDSDSKTIVNFSIPNIEENTLQMLVERYDNPLALEMFCSLYKNDFSDAVLRLSAEEIDELPDSMRALYEKAWEHLDDSVKRALSYASLGVQQMSETEVDGRDLSWNESLFLQAIKDAMSDPDSEVRGSGVVVDVFEKSVGTAAWARQVSESIQSFHEFDQWKTASEKKDYFRGDGRSKLMNALANVITSSGNDETDSVPTQDLLYRARLALNLHKSGFIDEHDLAKAVLPILERLDGKPLDLTLRISLGEQTLKNLSPDNERLTEVRSWHASSLHEAGQTDEAIPLYKSVLEDRLCVLGADHLDTLISRSNLAIAYKVVGRSDEAITLHEKVLEDLLRVLGTDHPYTLSARNNLATVYEVVGRSDEAITLLEKVLEDRLRVLGTDHRDTLSARNNLATVYEVVGRSDEAITLLEMVMEGFLRVLGADHPDTLTSRNNLASTYASAGRVGECISLHQSVLETRLRVLGADHPDTLTSCNNLAIAYQSVGRSDEAITLHEKVMEDFLRVLGTDHPYTLTSRNNLATAYRAVGRSDEAITLLEKVLEDLLRVLATDHPYTLSSRYNLATAYKAVGRSDEAITLHEKVLEDRLRVLGTDHPDTLSSRNNLASTYASAGRSDEAITLHEKVLEDRLRVLGTDHPDTLSSRNDLAFAYQSVGRFDEAITLLEKVMEDILRVLGTHHPDTLSSRGNLAFLYERVGRSDEAIQMYESLVKDR